MLVSRYGQTLSSHWICGHDLLLRELPFYPDRTDFSTVAGLALLQFFPYPGSSVKCSSGPWILHSLCPLPAVHPSPQALLTCPYNHDHWNMPSPKTFTNNASFLHLEASVACLERRRAPASRTHLAAGAVRPLARPGHARTAERGCGGPGARQPCPPAQRRPAGESHGAASRAAQPSSAQPNPAQPNWAQPSSAQLSPPRAAALRPCRAAGRAGTAPGREGREGREEQEGKEGKEGPRRPRCDAAEALPGAAIRVWGALPWVAAVLALQPGL